jgi:hypothetical protein
MENDIQKVKRLADYLKGYADAVNNKDMADASVWLIKTSRNICGQGFFGCEGGEDCDSDHK